MGAGPRKKGDAPAAPGRGAALGVLLVAVTAALSLLPSEPADRSDASTDALEDFLLKAESNVALPCLTRYSRKIKDQPKSVALAAAPTCWQEYWDFLHQNELPFFEDQALLATLGGERHVRFVRNSHVIAFQGKRSSRSPDLGQTSQQIELEMNRQACEAAVLKSFPEKKAKLVRSAISCDAYEAARAYGVLRG